MKSEFRSAFPLDPPALSQETLVASEAFLEGRYGEALESSERFVSQKPREAWSWRFRGECFLFLQRFDDASACFEKAMSLGASGTEDTFLWRALALQAAGEAEEARSILEAFIADESSRPELASKARTTLGTL